MHVAIGTFLVLLTWTFLIVLAIGLGLLPAALTHTRGPLGQLLRRALWWGIALGSVFLSALGLVMPLASPVVGVIVVTTAIVFGVTGFLVARRRGWTANSRRSTRRGLWWIVLVALVLAQVTFAIAALGPVTNYDTGLYHLGSIAYARDFATIPGLANLYGPFGYATIEFTWAAALSGTPWGADGFRLVNGFLMAAVAFDLAVRLRGPKRVGTYVLLVGMAVVWGPMLGMADYWVTSPTQDASALALSLIVGAYLTDAIAGRRNWITDVSVALVAGVILVAVRTTMGVFVLATVAVTIVLITRRRPALREFVPSALLLVFVALATTFVIGARDYVLSGWLLYPLSLYAFDVSWLAADPTPLREITLGFHRNPTDAAGALGNWAWIPDWAVRNQRTWEFPAVVLLTAVLVTTALLTRLQHSRIPWRRIAIATMPAVLAVVVWFFANPPTPRFIWGPLFLMFVIPIGWFLAMPPRFLTNSLVLLITTTVIVSAAVATLWIRIDWASMTAERQWEGIVPANYLVTPIRDAPTITSEMPSGLLIDIPSQTDQCWANYPLCSPGASPTLSSRGKGVGDGFNQ